MIRKCVQKLIPYSEEIFVSKRQWMRVIKRVDKKIKDLIIQCIIILLIVLFVGCSLYLYEEPSGYYAADGYDSNGALIDTDGDGDTYHWVEE